MALSARHQRFVAEMLIDDNATQAYIRAGYSPKHADVNAAILMARPDIQEALAQARAERAKRLQIDADWVLKRLHGDATADLAELYADDGSIKPIKEWPMVFRTGLVAGIEFAELFDGTGDSRKVIGHVRKLKLIDRTKTVELIGKHVDVGAFRERSDVSVTHSFEQMTEEQLAAEIAAYERPASEGAEGGGKA